MKAIEKLQVYFDDYMFLQKRLEAVRCDLKSMATKGTRDDAYIKKLQEENWLKTLQKDRAKSIRIQLEIVETDE